MYYNRMNMNAINAAKRMTYSLSLQLANNSIFEGAHFRTPQHIRLPMSMSHGKLHRII